MMKHFLTTVILSFFSLFVNAQLIDSLFVSAPSAVLPLLEYNSRLDMLDLYNCKMTAKVYNDLSGEACLIEKDSLHFKVQTTSSSFLELRILPLAKDTLYCCVRTVKMPEEHSQILFMDTRWHPVKIRLPQNISFERCWVPSDSLGQDRKENLRLALSPYSIYMTWETQSDGSPVLVCQVSVEGLMSRDRKDALQCLRPLKYKWNKGKFEEVQ